MQARYSHDLNVKYEKTPCLLLAPYHGPRDLGSFSPYLRQGPRTGPPRYHAQFLDAAGFQGFLRYLENNPVKAGLVRRAVDWPWSSAPAHASGKADWQAYLEEHVNAELQNAARLRGTGSCWNRPPPWHEASPPAS